MSPKTNSLNSYDVQIVSNQGRRRKEKSQQKNNAGKTETDYDSI